MKVLDVIRALDVRSYDLFRHIVEKSKGEYYLAGGTNKEKYMSRENISDSTYWRKVKKLETLGLLLKDSKGFYLVNRQLMKIVEDLDKKLVKSFR